MSRKEDEDVCVTQLYRSPGPLPTRPWGVLTELVSYMYPIYVHYMYILDVLSFPFGSRHRPYWDCEVRSKSEWRVSCIAPTVLWLLYNTDHNWQIYRGHAPWHIWTWTWRNRRFFSIILIFCIDTPKINHRFMALRLQAQQGVVVAARCLPGWSKVSLGWSWSCFQKQNDASKRGRHVQITMKHKD